ncbi:MAG TPA: hypothetical protein VGN78_12520 [Solirubrobacteraceae bacterium]|jgi:hypothetical protein|nr:hypothetical protein [Solirubrobacteraceae bacterium]
MRENEHIPPATEEHRRDAHPSSPAQAAPPPSPPADEYDLARGREQLRRVLAK